MKHWIYLSLFSIGLVYNIVKLFRKPEFNDSSHKRLWKENTILWIWIYLALSIYQIDSIVNE